MTIITADGTLEFGQPLTDEEVEIVRELGPSGGALADASGVYLTDRAAKKMVHFLIANFYMCRRQPATLIEGTNAVQVVAEVA